MVVLQSLASWYLAVLAFVANAILLVWLHASSVRSGWGKRLGQLTLVSCAAAAILLPFARPYRNLPAVPPAAKAALSADIAAYVIPPANTWAGQLWLKHVGAGPRWIWGERTLFLGYIAVAFAVAGLIDLRRRGAWRGAGVYAVFVAAGLALSFGPTLVGEREGWSAFGLVAQLPGFSGFRAPARFAVLVVLGLAVLAARGIAAAEGRFGRPGTLAIVALMPLMLSEWYIVDFPGGKPQPFDIPPIYRLAVIRGARAIASLPEYRGRPDWYLGADYLFFSTAHWRPIVNGYGRAEPPGHPRVVSHLRAFPGPNNAKTMRALGVEYVVVHAARDPGSEQVIQEARASPEYELVAHLGDDYLFKVKPAP